ncbi:heat shock protein GrpE [Candidatus Arthromitus sp. SFB-rat-Yit]|nr:heat shock protein GrpE [Candidatus Arthromitus sp. SFB-rat-Yit]
MTDENNVTSEENVEEKNVEEDLKQNLEDESQNNIVDKIQELEKENEELKSQIDSLKDKMLRISAEYDNFRKRSVREKSEIYNNSCADVIFEVLPILDNLERANSSSYDMDSFKQGISMVIKLFNNVLDKMNVKEISCESGFDPNIHEAVIHVNDENLEKNTIVEVLQKGYMINDKIIRHSMVKVAN